MRAVRMFELSPLVTAASAPARSAPASSSVVAVEAEADDLGRRPSPGAGGGTPPAFLSMTATRVAVARRARWRGRDPTRPQPTTTTCTALSNTPRTGRTTHPVLALSSEDCASASRVARQTTGDDDPAIHASSGRPGDRRADDRPARAALVPAEAQAARPAARHRAPLRRAPRQSDRARRARAGLHLLDGVRLRGDPHRARAGRRCGGVRLLLPITFAVIAVLFFSNT